MNATLIKFGVNPESRQAHLNLQNWNILLNPPPRIMPQTLPLAHVPLHQSGTILEIHANQSLTVLINPPPKTTERVVSVSFFLKYEARTLDYHENFTPTSFTNTIHVDRPPTHSPPSNQPLIMNILSWNVRGVAGADFRRVFREIIASHIPYVFVLTETRVSGDRANAILATLGFDRYVKVDGICWGCLCSLEPSTYLHGTAGIFVSGNSSPSQGKS